VKRGKSIVTGPTTRSIAALLFLMAIGCSERAAPVKAQATAHAAELLSSSKGVWQTHRRGEVPESAWPASVRALAPSRVVAADEGIYVYVYSRYEDVTGIFLRCDPSFAPPPVKPDSDDMGYERLANDVYFFSRPR
jgi:hypothetical protein